MWDTAGTGCKQGMDRSEIQEASKSAYCLQDQYKLVLQGGDPEQLSHQRTSSYLKFGDNIQAATSQWNTGVGAVLQQVHMQLQCVKSLPAIPWRSQARALPLSCTCLVLAHVDLT